MACEVQSDVSGTSLRSHPHHSSAHAHDRASLHRTGNEMRKLNAVESSDLFRWYVCCNVFKTVLSVLVFQLDADDAKVTFEEEPGKDVYCESQMPL